MKRKGTKKQNSGGRHRLPVADQEQHGAPAVPIDVLVEQGEVPAPDLPPALASEPSAAPLAPLLLTVEQACALLGASRAHFFRMKKAGQLPGCVNLGGLVRYRREDIEDFVRQLKPSP